MKKIYFNSIVISLFAALISVFCSAYFLLCSGADYSLTGFAFCAISAVLSLIVQLAAFNSKGVGGAFSGFGSISASGVYIIATVILWIASPLFKANVNVLIFIEIAILAVYVALSVAVIAFSHHQNRTEQDEEVNLHTYMLCSTILQEAALADIDPDIRKRISDISEQVKYIKSADRSVNDEIAATVLTVQKIIKEEKFNDVLIEKVRILEKIVQQQAVGVKR